MRTNKWEFKAQAQALIDFDKMAEELTGEHPIIFVHHGKRDKYVLIKASLLIKASVLDIAMPEIIGSMNKTDYACHTTNVEFFEWLKWARAVKSASWPETDRKDSVVRVSMPTI